MGINEYMKGNRYRDVVLLVLCPVWFSNAVAAVNRCGGDGGQTERTAAGKLSVLSVSVRSLEYRSLLQSLCVSAFLFRGDEAPPLPPPPLSPLVFNTVASEGVRASATGVCGGVRSLMPYSSQCKVTGPWPAVSDALSRSQLEGVSSPAPESSVGHYDSGGED